MKNEILLSAALGGLAVTPAAAQAPPLFTWFGFYAGAHVSYTWGNKHQSISYFDPSGTYAALPKTAFPTTLGGTGDGLGGGVHAGYNFQFGLFLLGLEADIDGLSEKRSGYFSTAGVITTLGGTTVQTSFSTTTFGGSTIFSTLTFGASTSVLTTVFGGTTNFSTSVFGQQTSLITTVFGGTTIFSTTFLTTTLGSSPSIFTTTTGAVVNSTTFGATTNISTIITGGTVTTSTITFGATTLLSTITTGGTLSVSTSTIGATTSIQTLTSIVTSGSVTTPFTTVAIGRASIDWVSTIRGRVGTTVDRALIYVTGGLAIGGYHQSATITTITPGGTYSITNSRSATRVGWALGAGVEFAVSPAVLLRVEYLHFDLGRVSYTIGPAAPGKPFAIGHQRLDGDSVRIGASYKF